MQRACVHFRCGYTLPELVLVVTIAGLASAIGARALARHLDRLAVQAAVAEAAGALARARDEALARHAVVGVRIDTPRATVTLRARGARPVAYALGHAHGVSLSTTRDSLAFDARGLGYGAANLTLVARRGAAADTLVVSRLGRLRW
ncbi:MAG TPA: GspH/FimT family pseudopilin [Gemmatimonadaceae bacterium]|nr:GspH/FimT family pseudopilin [Gemmatimonadaceae bacterium]